MHRVTADAVLDLPVDAAGGEINREKYALKTLRGDFAGVASAGKSAAEAANCAAQATRH